MQQRITELIVLLTVARSTARIAYYESPSDDTQRALDACEAAILCARYLAEAALAAAAKEGTVIDVEVA